MFRFLGIFIAVFIVATCNKVHAFTVYSSSLPPLHYQLRNGSPEGYTFDVLELVMKDAGVSFYREQIKFLPWARALQNVERMPDTMLVGVARSLNRESKFLWLGPFFDLELGLVSKKIRKLKISNPAQLKELKIAVVRNSAPMYILQSDFGISEDSVDSVTNEISQMLMLANDRVDAVTHTSATYAFALKELGLNPDEYEFSYVMKTLPLFIACNPEQQPELVESLQKSLTALRQKQGGEIIKDILHKYIP